MNKWAYLTIFAIIGLMILGFYKAWLETLIVSTIMVWLLYEMIQTMKGRESRFSINALAVGIGAMVMLLIMVATS